MSNIAQLVESSRALLDAVYRELGYRNGQLLSAISSPKPDTPEAEAWLEKGDWLALAAKVEAEKIFFVENAPVIVFRELPDDDPQKHLETFRQAWCMARPQCLFIATPGLLRAYSLNQHPVQTVDEWKNIDPLATIKRTLEISEKLQAFRREQVESGQLFNEKNFGELEQRADKRLIQDLKVVRQSLLNAEPQIDHRYVHTLIGRSIFVRYLEDRGILTPEYFEKVATDTNNPRWDSKWNEILQTPEEKDLAPNSEKRRYSRVLRDKELTYAVFDQLTEDFNGDIFAHNPKEEKAVTQKHLDLLRRFLLGDTDIVQQQLFLWAYDFEIVPIELVSSIYEEFYHSPTDKQTDDKSTHYTPSVLVEYVLSQLLTHERLTQNPKILDFACGSGIFLVQAFRRIVRYRQKKLERLLFPDELRKILREQITGIEINPEAVYVAAFSLSLALLHYQESESIKAQMEQTRGEKPLPHLIFKPNQPQDAAHYHALFHANSFSLMDSEREWIKQKLDAKHRFCGRVEYEKLYHSQGSLPFQPNTFDVVVGNPPWGYLKKNEGTPELRDAQEHVLRWCKVFDWSIGDNELSQAFITRASSFLKLEGECGLLVSAGVFLKRHENSQKFRQRWLSENVIKKVVSFTHVREIFFSKAIAPFYFVQYQLGKADSTHRVQYWSAKKTELVDKVQSVILSLTDLHQVRQEELAYNELLWKVYWWGDHRHAALISVLGLEDNLGQLIQKRNWSKGQGYTPGSIRPRNGLEKYLELPIENFERYGPIAEQGLRQVPEKVHRLGILNLYTGWQLLVKQGITQEGRTNGRIEARLENKSYGFRNSIHGIKMDNAEDWERKVLVGMLWSSVARYYLFVTTGAWGTWHHEIHLEDGLMRLPIRFPENQDLRQRIIDIVDKLRSLPNDQRSLLTSDSSIREKQESLERELDEAIFELYELNESERDLILDMCEVGLEFFYQKGTSEAVKRVAVTKTQGTANDLSADRNREQGLEGYLYAFLQMWNRELETVGGEFRWHIIRAPHAPMLAVKFTTQLKGEKLPHISSSDEQAWHDLLNRLDAASLHPVSHRIYIDNMVRVVTDTDIFIIKRDERRLWTRSMAREDAEATLLQAMHLEGKRL